MNSRALIDAINQRINDVSDKYIKFKICYLLYLAGLVSCILWIIAIYFSLNVISLNSFNEYVTSPGFLLIGVVVFLYIYLGYIKYAQLIQDVKLRKTFIIVIAIWIADVILSNIGYPMDWIMKKVAFASICSTLLLFYAFKQLKNDESLFFNKLSKLNLYMFIIHLVILAQQLSSVKQVIFISYFILASLALFAFYWEAKLFRHLYYKYEKVPDAIV